VGKGTPEQGDEPVLPATMNKLTGTTTVVDDLALLNEVDDMVRKKMAEREQAGAERDELLELADKYARMLDLLDARLTGQRSGETEAFKRQTFSALEEGFYEKIEVIYDPDRKVTAEMAESVIAQTRGKIQRLEQALFSPEV